ncbi:DUF547 domain-containing protein [Rheinheimera salexigens]|uniref:DUF547 domain-containing protein n=1 Tax=Rheinheimera salexigens TaxID=1628148 RepID=A0A1E7Q7I4_9GAMM|nr:DUF547 domain-containing protein [Rheinheimera salexigens]OEY70129.1 hypothetical protein BI198_11560 [Rheinheimera salexigens]
MYKFALILLILASLTGNRVLAFDHQAFDQLLHKSVVTVATGHSTEVNYLLLQQQRQQLKAYLASLSAVERATFDSWPQAERLAFLLNAYNGWTLELVLSQYPKLESIKDIGSFWQSPWKKRFIPLFGNTLSLDQIEHDLIRGKQGFAEPRIHFAVNCASIGCPALREEAYTAEQLDAQLEQQTERFLADSSRNYYADNTLYLSAIFKWYAADFQQNWQQTNSLMAFILRYSAAMGLTPQQQQTLRDGSVSVKYLDYDWRLNAYKP